MEKRNIPVEAKEIEENYENYFNFLIERSDEKLKWPHAIFPMVKIKINPLYS